ncbi:MAG TPA: hypothetical protein VMK30_02195 [Pleomorphomonadaceae bacterium]|nr:hypothetical protein [Pleomorphomonadaceae bacterium]
MDIAPWVMVGALALAVAPLLWAGAEKEIVPATSVEMVDRFVPTTVTYVSLPGLAMNVSLPAPGSRSAPPYGLLVRDAAGADAFTIVTSDVAPERLEARWVVGRVTTRPVAAAAIAVIDARGEATTGLDGSTLLIEVTPQADEPITDVQAVAELAGMTDGTLVRIPLRFAGESMPTCALAVEGCRARLLATGNGIFVHLALGIPDPEPILVQTAYPSSVVPGRWTGPQVRNGPDLEAFTSTLPVQALAGSGRILVLASIVDEPGLVRDRQWLGPALLALLAGILWLGGRTGYPFFRPTVEGSRRYGSAFAVQKGPVTPLPAQGIPVRVSGHATTVDGRWAHLDEVRAVLLPSSTRPDGNRATAALSLPDGEEVALAAYDIGALGSVERGEVVRVGDVRPALWAHWFGTDLRLMFGSAAERDLAAAIARTGGPPLGSDR